MVITSSILFYQMSKKCDIELKKSPSDKLYIKNIRVFENNKTEVGALYIVDVKKHKEKIISKKPVTFVFINIDDIDSYSFPRNSDYCIISDVRSEIEMFSIISDSVNELQEWDCSLKDSVNYRHTLKEFIPIANRVYTDSITILTRNLSVIDFSSSDKITSLDTSIASNLISNAEYSNSLTYIDAYKYSLSDGAYNLCLNIFSENRYIAKVMSPVRIYNDNIDEGQLQLFKHIYKYLKLIYLRYSDDPLIKSEADKLHNLIYDYIKNSDKIDPISTNLILNNYGWNVNDKYSVMQFVFFKNSKWDEFTEYICAKLEETWNNSCAIKDENKIIWVINHSISKSVADEKKFFHVLTYIVRDFVCKAGVSDTFTGISRIPAYIRQSQMALRIGQKRHPDRWYFKFSDYAMDYMFDRIISEFDIKQLIHTGVRNLMDYDRRNGTDFIPTLRCFLNNNCNSTHTADELYIHRTTLIRRIDRIEELADIDFNDHETYVHLIMSFWILEKIGYKFETHSNSENEDTQLS